jgi:hypothetical protein
MIINDIKIYKYIGVGIGGDLYILGSMVNGSLNGVSIRSTAPGITPGLYEECWSTHADYKLVTDPVEIDMTNFKYAHGILFFRYNNQIQFVNLKYKTISIVDQVRTPIDSFNKIKDINKPIIIRNL